jgi:hypothetical protein
MRLLAILLASITLAPLLRGAPPPPWLLRLNAGIRYDDNVLRYSERYLEAFRTRDDAGRFHIGTSDDAIMALGVRLDRILFPRHDLRTTVYAEGEYSRYLRNTVKNWGSLGVGIRQELPFRASLSIAYDYIPAFYLRHYRDQDWVDAGISGSAAYQPFSYERDDVRTSLAATLPTGTGLRFGVAGGRLFHNEHFTEYDARTTTWTWEASQRAGPVRVALRYDYETSRSRRPVPGTTDASYDEDEGRASVSWTLQMLGYPLLCEGGASYARRCFTTTSAVELDPLHAGRVDHTVTFSLAVGASLTSALDVGIGAAWRRRDATGAPANDASLSLERDFTQFQMEATVEYALRF